MTFGYYQTRARQTAIYLRECNTIEEAVDYTALGLASEAGEVAGEAKRIIRDDHRHLTPERRDKIIKELGDVLWYVAETASNLNIPLEVVAERNLTLLGVRQEQGKIHGSGSDR